MPTQYESYSSRDCGELAQALNVMSTDVGTTYLRIARGPMKTIFERSHKFEIGRGYQFEKGRDLTIVSTGITTSIAMDALAKLKKNGINARVVHLPTLKPVDSDLIIKCAKEAGAIIIVEDHSINGGLGGLISEIVTRDYPAYKEAAYRVSKTGVQVFAETVAIELAPYGIRVNTVSPGLINSPNWAKGILSKVVNDPKIGKSFMSNIPLVGLVYQKI